jgi:NADH:ubiquinone oxidoreductase subunit 3 (subunit A)
MNFAQFLKTDKLMSADSLILFFIVATVLVGGAILFSTFMAPTSSNPAKFEPYECGIPTKGTTWLQFNVGYYLFAILFLVFDVETVFVFPWAVVMKELGMVAFVEIVIFFFVLVLGLAYAWKKKALVWE